MFQGLRADPFAAMFKSVVAHGPISYKQFPSMRDMGGMGFPRMRFPKFPKLTAQDFAGGTASMTTSSFHCVNGVCDGKAVKGKWTVPVHPVSAK